MYGYCYGVHVVIHSLACPHLDLSSSKDPLPDPLSPVSSGIPHTQLWVPLLPHPVTRRGVRGLIICTDPGLSPQGGCVGTVALDPIDTVRGRRRGEENRPWLQSVGPPRQVDECPGLHDLCHPSQWSQATMSYSLLVKKPSYPPPPSPPPPSPPNSPRVPPSPRIRAGWPPSFHKHWRSILDCPTPPPPSPFQLSDLTAPILPGNTHRHKFNHRLAQVPCLWHFNTALAPNGRLLQSWCIHEPDTWLFINIDSYKYVCKWYHTWGHIVSMTE